MLSKTKILALFIPAIVLFAGCSSNSFPEGSYLEKQKEIAKEKQVKLIAAVFAGDHKEVERNVTNDNVNTIYHNSLSQNIGRYFVALKTISGYGGFDALFEAEQNNIDRYSLLMIASRKGYKDIVITLLEYGAKINYKAIHPNTRTINSTAISEAYFNGHYEIADLLVKNGANPTFKNEKYGGLSTKNCILTKVCAKACLSTKHIESIFEDKCTYKTKQELLKSILNKTH